MELSAEAVAGDAAVMREFRQSQAYDVFHKYADAMAEDWTTRLVNNIGDPKSDYYRGVLAGLKMATQIPDNVRELSKRSKQA